MLELTIEEQIEKVKADLKRFKAAGSQARLHQILERDGAHDMLRQLKHKFQKDINPKLLRERPLKQYSQCVKRVSYQSAYVLTFEARMCRSLHIMAILEQQLGLTKEECKKRIESYESAGEHEKEEELHAEMKLLNDLVLAENSKREMEAAYKEILKKQEMALSKLEREAWGRSLTGFSVDDTSFVLPSISEEQSKEGRLSAMLDHNLTQPPGTFKLDDVSLGTAEMAPPPPKGKDLLPPLQKESSSSDDSEESEQEDEASSEDEYSNRHEELEKAADADTHESTVDEDEGEYSDSSSEDGDYEFLSPEEADFDTEYPWRKYHSKSYNMVTDDEQDYEEEESEFSRRDQYDEEESEFSRRDQYEDEESESSHRDRYDEEESEFSRRDEDHYEDEESEYSRRDNHDEKRRDDETEYTGYDDETDYPGYPKAEGSEAGETEDDDEDAEFVSPDDAPPAGTPNPWRRSSSRNLAGAASPTAEKMMESVSEANDRELPAEMEVDEGDRPEESRNISHQYDDDLRSEDSQDKRGYAKQWGAENDSRFQDSFQDSYQESYDESWREVSEHERSSSDSDYSESDSDTESESSSESWNERSSVGSVEAKDDELDPSKRTAETNPLSVSPDNYESLHSQESETSSRSSASSSASESGQSSASETEYEQSVSTYSEEPRGHLSNDIIKKEVALNYEIYPQRDGEYGDDESPRSVADMGYLARQATRRFSNSSSKMDVCIPPPVPEKPVEEPSNVVQSFYTSPSSSSREGPNHSQSNGHTNLDQNIVKHSPERSSRSPGPSLLQQNESPRPHVYRNTQPNESEEDRPSLNPTFSDRFNRNYPRGESMDKSIGSSASKRLESPGSCGHRRPLISKTFSSQGLLRQIEMQSWCSAELTKHALVDDEGWEFDRGQGRIAPLARHRLLLSQDGDSVESKG